jgi:hypothetical protein
MLLLEVPPLLREILEHAIDADFACEVMTCSEGAAMAGRPKAPDAVILGLRAAGDEMLVPSLLAQWPRAHILTMLQGDAAVIYELRPRRRVLRELSPAEMVEKLRDSVRRSRNRSSERLEDNDARSL